MFIPRKKKLWELGLIGAFSDTYVQLFAGSTNWTSLKEITLCLEYTKTTD